MESKVESWGTSKNQNESDLWVQMEKFSFCVLFSHQAHPTFKIALVIQKAELFFGTASAEQRYVEVQ